MSRPTSTRTTMGSTRTRPCSQPQRWSSGSARRPRDHSQPLGSGLEPTKRGPEPAGEICGGIYRPCFPSSRVPHARLRFGRHALGSNFWRGLQVGKSGLSRCVFLHGITKNRCYQPSFCTVGGKGPKWSYQPCHPCRGALSSSPVHRALVLVLGTNIAVLLDCSKWSRQCSLYYLLTYLHRKRRAVIT